MSNFQISSYFLGFRAIRERKQEPRHRGKKVMFSFRERCSLCWQYECLEFQNTEPPRLSTKQIECELNRIKKIKLYKLMVFENEI